MGISYNGIKEVVPSFLKELPTHWWRRRCLCVEAKREGESSIYTDNVQVKTHTKLEEAQ